MFTHNDVRVTACEEEEEEETREAFPTGLHVNICCVYFKTIWGRQTEVNTLGG